MNHYAETSFMSLLCYIYNCRIFVYGSRKFRIDANIVNSDVSNEYYTKADKSNDAIFSKSDCDNAGAVLLNSAKLYYYI